VYFSRTGTVGLLQMYERLYPLKSPNGVTIDKCIQPSVDNKGDIIGLVAGDPECYEVPYNNSTAVSTVEYSNTVQLSNTVH